MKKIISTLLVLVFALSLFACVDENTDTSIEASGLSDTESEPSTTEDETSADQSADTSSEGEDPSKAYDVSEPDDTSAPDESVPGESSNSDPEPPSESSQPVIFMDPQPDGEKTREFQHDAYPGKTLIRKSLISHYSPYPFFIVDEEIAELDWLDGTAKVFKGRYAEMRNAPGKDYYYNTVTEKDCYAIDYDDELEIFYSDETPMIIGNFVLAYSGSFDNDGAQDYTVIDCGKIVGEPVFGTSYIRAQVFDKVLFNEESDYIPVYEFQVGWLILGKDGQWRILPEEIDPPAYNMEFNAESDNPNEVIISFREYLKKPTMIFDLDNTIVIDDPSSVSMYGYNDDPED